MTKYFNIFIESYSSYWGYLQNEVLSPSWHNYFYWLVGITLLVWALEIIFPWRKNQGIIRKGFWIDTFYLFFNFFIFSLILYNGLSNVAVTFFNDLLHSLGINNLVAIEIQALPLFLRFVIAYLFIDFIQWNIHRLLHRVPWMWNFHKVHHSVKQMGFAAHFRFHWMETVFYKSIQYVPLAMVGFGIDDFFVIHILSITIGHLNHSNLCLDYGILKYLLNNPKMHIWHHAKELPTEKQYGVNFGISFSCWDYLFGTAFIPKDGKNVPLGFDKDETFPSELKDQLILPYKHKRRRGNE